MCKSRSLSGIYNSSDSLAMYVCLMRCVWRWWVYSMSSDGWTVVNSFQGIPWSVGEVLSWHSRVLSLQTQVMQQSVNAVSVSTFVLCHFILTHSLLWVWSLAPVCLLSHCSNLSEISVLYEMTSQQWFVRPHPLLHPLPHLYNVPLADLSTHTLLVWFSVAPLASLSRLLPPASVQSVSWFEPRAFFDLWN